MLRWIYQMMGYELRAISKRNRVITIAAIVVVLVAAAVYLHYWHPHAKSVFYPKSPEPSIEPTSSATQTPSSNSQASSIPLSAKPQSNAANTISVTAPTQGSSVTSGTKVTGSTQVAESKLYFRLKGGKSGQLAGGSIAVTPNPPSPEAFNFELDFTNQVAGGSDQGVLEVYTLDPTSGAETNVANVTVNIGG